MTIEDSHHHWRNRAFTTLRGVCFLLSIAYGWTHREPSEVGLIVVYMSILFGGYSLLCYGLWRYSFPDLTAPRFYLWLSLLDFAFIVVLLAMTGGPDSPMSRGLYVWVSMTAILFHFKGGLLASLVAIVAFLGLEWRYQWPLEAWEQCFYLLGFLVHGPFVGHFMTREYRRSKDLEDAHDALDLAHRRLKTHQAQAVQTEKLATIGLLGASLAHEINNPVMGMKACVRILRSDAQTPTRREEYLDTVEAGLERIRRSVSSVLRYARPERLPPELIPLEDSLRNVTHLVAALAGEKHLHVQVESSPVTVWMATELLEQALVNLLLNAIHATPNGGTICCRIRHASSHIEIEVEDEGAGFDLSLEPRLREPFFTTKSEGAGTGLGLSIVDGFMRGIGGHLRLANSEIGAVATLEIPLSCVAKEFDDESKVQGGRRENIPGR